MLLLYMIMNYIVTYATPNWPHNLNTQQIKFSPSQDHHQTPVSFKPLYSPSHQFIGRPWKLPAGQALTLDFW